MDPHEEYFRSLSKEDRVLLRLKEALYEGSWAELEADLVARKEGKPFVFKLESQIDEDLDRIARLKAYEEQTGADLGSYLPRKREEQR